MADAPESDYEFDDRDVAILQEIARDPQLSMREVADRLAEEYGIETSHVTVSGAVRRMREAGVFREAVLPNETYYRFAFFEFKLDPDGFEDGWRDAMEHIRGDRHTLFYFLSDGEYQWKAVMMFPDAETHSRWIHEFYKDHGGVITNLRNSVVHNVLKFRTDPRLFGTLGPDD